MHSLTFAVMFLLAVFLIAPAGGMVVGGILIGACELLAWITGANKYQAPPLEPTQRTPETKTVIEPESPWTYEQMLEHRRPEGMSAADREQLLWEIKSGYRRNQRHG